MSHRNGQGDVAHPFPADFLLCHLDAAPVADDSAVADPLVLSAVAFVVLCRSEYLFAEETVPFRLVGPVVDCLRLQDLAAGLAEMSSGEASEMLIVEKLLFTLFSLLLKVGIFLNVNILEN